MRIIILSLACGQHNENLARIEQALDVSLDSFGNQITITGPAEAMQQAGDVLKNLYKQLASGDGGEGTVSRQLIDDMLRMAEHGQDQPSWRKTVNWWPHTWRKKIHARTKGQLAYFELMEKNELCLVWAQRGRAKPIWRWQRLLIR